MIPEWDERREPSLSFSLEVKMELSHIEESAACCRRAELAGILRAGLAMRDTTDGPRLLLTTENASLSRRIFTMIKEIYRFEPKVHMSRMRRFKAHAVYRLDFSGLLEDGGKKVLDSIGLSADLDSGVIVHHNYRLRSRCCKRAYLRGCFMANGSISDPDKSYHLEVAFRSKEQADEFMHYLGEFGLEPRSIMRKNQYLVYLKEGQEIVDFLNVIGAHNALMNLENIRIMKEMRNQVNRIVNCETANLTKTVDASLRQTESIRYIKEHSGLETLPKPLYEIALLRLDNPDVSLTELGRMLNPPLSKSGVNHRLRKIEKIAESLGFDPNT